MVSHKVCIKQYSAIERVVEGMKDLPGNREDTVDVLVLLSDKAKVAGAKLALGNRHADICI